MWKTNLLKRSIAALGFVLLAAPAMAATTWRSWALNASGCNPADSAHPCAMEEDIVRAMSGVATQSNWQTKLDAGNFNAWANKGSNNLPVLAGAIALWEGTPIGGQPPQNWWITFLTCQTAGDTCSIPLPNNVRYFDGYEILSPLYNAPAVSAVVAVRYWATTRNPTLFNLATTYLKMTSALYTLGAGTGPARTALRDVFTQTSSGTCPPPPTFSASRTSSGCDTGNSGGTVYDGPFLALAGGRSFYTSCANSGGQGDREPLFVRAVQWPGVTHSSETREQEDLLDYVENHWPAGQSTNPYGNDASRRALLQNHVNGSPYDPGTIVTILRGARFIREYRFLTWPGVRVTVLSSNPDNCGKFCTAAMYAVEYDASTAQATYLYPWPGDIRTEITQGYGQLVPNNSAPTSVVARNIDPALGETATCTHGDTSISLSLPAGAPLFQVVLEPTTDATVQ